MPEILLVADASWVVGDARSAFGEGDFDLEVLDDPRDAAPLWSERRFDAVVVDLQVGSMGGMAVTRAIRDAAAAAGAEPPPILLLLDREADAFLAGRAGADAWVRKPCAAGDLRTAVESLLSTSGGDTAE
jgi:DNA-binding response OmpR family regulator